MSEQAPPPAAPGWYHVDASTMRWWDGQAWGEPRRTRPPQKPVSNLGIASIGVVSLGFFIGWLLPLLGIVMSVVALGLGVGGLFTKTRVLPVIAVSISTVVLVVQVVYAATLVSQQM